MYPAGKSYCKKYKNEYDITMITSDKDFYQLLDDNIKIFNIATKQDFTKNDFVAKYGIQPLQWIDACALSGDDGDTIEGIDGIAEITAVKIIKKYGNVQGAIDEIGSIIKKSKVEEKLIQGVEKIKIAYELKKMILNLEVPAFQMRHMDRYQLEKMMEDYKLYMLKKDIEYLIDEPLESRILRTESNSATKKFFTCQTCGTTYMSESTVECERCKMSEQMTFKFE